MVELLLGLKLGYTKFYCILCECDSRDRKNQYIKGWQTIEALTVEEKKNGLALVNQKIFIYCHNIFNEKFCSSNGP